MNAGQVDAIFRSIAASQEELRKECQANYVTKIAMNDHEIANKEAFDNLIQKTDHIQDEIQKQIETLKKDHLKLFGSVQILQADLAENKKTTHQHSNNIIDIFEALNDLSSRPKVASGSEPVPPDALDLFHELKQLMNQKMDKAEARSNHEDLLKRIADLSRSGDGMVISESDFHKWNNNCTETARLEEQLKRMAKEIALIEPHVIKSEINHINALILTFCSK